MFILVLAVFMISSFLLKVYPFGGNTFLWTDSDQYLAVDSYFSTLLGKMIFFILGGMYLVEMLYRCYLIIVLVH